MNLIKNFLYPNKNDILDPLSTVIKLYIYSFKPLGTKMSILGNKIVIQDIGIFQSTVRTINRDTKTDLINILFPLVYACEIYLSDNSDQKFRIIFNRIIKSLNDLNTLYQINEMNHNIEQLKNIVTNFLSDKNFNPNTIILNWDEPASKLKKSFYAQTNLIWTEDRLNILFGYINEISNTNQDDLINNLVFSLSSFMNYIDLLIVKLITNMHVLR